MYLLNTNVVSELRKQKPHGESQNVSRWASSVSATDLYLSAVTLLEIEVGVLLMERKDVLQGAMLRRWLGEKVLPAFAGRILSIDLEVATRSAQLHVPDRRPGYDALIAATALVHRMTLITRNVADFAGTGVALLNPWDA